MRLKGYSIIASRYRSKLGEIDIVAKRGKTLAFVEVKARQTYQQAAEAFMSQQRERIKKGALDFISRHPHYINYVIRFDVMLVTPRRWPRHIINAWEESMK